MPCFACLHFRAPFAQQSECLLQEIEESLKKNQELRDVIKEQGEAVQQLQKGTGRKSCSAGRDDVESWQ